jgi:hypothetical protein
MDRRKFLGVMGLAGMAAAIPASAGMALGQTADPSQESTVTDLPDGSLSIEGHIVYDKGLRAYVVQALVPAGSHGRYLIDNPDKKVLSAMAKKKNPLVVQGMLNEGAFLLQVQTINGKAYK